MRLLVAASSGTRGRQLPLCSACPLGPGFSPQHPATACLHRSRPPSGPPLGVDRSFGPRHPHLPRPTCTLRVAWISYPLSVGLPGTEDGAVGGHETGRGAGFDAAHLRTGVVGPDRPLLRSRKDMIARPVRGLSGREGYRGTSPISREVSRGNRCLSLAIDRLGLRLRYVYSTLYSEIWNPFLPDVLTRYIAASARFTAES